jgi:hypothetical protein
MTGASSDSEVMRRQVGGLRVFTVDLPEPAVAALVFRVGIADESLALRGITHLVEHLALFGSETIGSLEVNGFVDLNRTMLWARGSESEAVEFLRRVAATIRELPLDRLEDERRILQIESAGNHGRLLDRLLRLRFGGYGYGMGDYVEKGLGWLDGARVQEWANERFCAANAVCLLTRPIADGLEISLPEGAASRLPPLDHLPGIRFPVERTEGTGGIALTMIADRSWESVAALDFITRGLHNELRLQHGLSYAVSSDYLPLAGNAAHLTLTADCLDRYAVDVRTRMLREVDRLATKGPTQEALTEWQQGCEGALDNEQELASDELQRVANTILMGEKELTFEENHTTRRQLTPEAIAKSLTDALESAMLLVPEGTDGPPAGFQRLATRHHHIPAGKTFRFRRSGLNAQQRRRRLVISEAEICLVPYMADPVTIATKDCIGVERSDDSLTLFGRDGSWLQFNPAELTNETGAMNALTAIVPPQQFFAGSRISDSDIDWEPRSWPRRLLARAGGSILLFAVIVFAVGAIENFSRGNPAAGLLGLLVAALLALPLMRGR